MGAAASQSYKLKATTGKFNVHRSKYTDAQIQKIMDDNAEILYHFGYVNHPTDDNQTAFFEYKNHKQENLDKYYGFRKDNDRHLATLVKDDGWKGPKYSVNKDKECFDFYPEELIEKVQEPCRDRKSVV